jgi:2',3'-cyclic-nucleotide 2'-phosphodiesterase/3'-nucleotidase
MPHRPLSRRAFLATTGAGATLIALHPFSARAAANQAHLRIMETTDLHVHVLPYDYYADRPVDTVGLARTAAHVKAIRAEATNSLLIDNGDFLQGNPMGDYMAYERGLKPGDLHPVIAALNTVGIEASTLGNHEFNYGLDFLMTALAGANFPIVSANVVRETGADPTKDRGLLKPYVILDRVLRDGDGTGHPIRIGLIGFVPPQIMQWDRGHLEGKVQTRDIVQAAQAWVPVMREEGADIVIALSHSGIGSARHSEGMENASVPLAAVAGIDALLTGHSHLVYPSPTFDGFDMVDAKTGLIHGKPAVMAGFWGDTLGVIDLLLERDGNAWRVVSTAVETRPIYRRNEDRSITPLVASVPEIEAAVQTDHAATLAYIRRAVGRTAAPLYSYFALVADDPSVQIVSQAQTWYIARMLKGTAYETLPLLSAAPPPPGGGPPGAAAEQPRSLTKHPRPRK